MIKRSFDLLPLISPSQAQVMDPALLDPVDYRKSGLSLNHIVGCPLDCAYCIRHVFGNFEMKKPHALMADEDAVAYLCSHRYFRPGRTPLQIFNRATDPFLPAVKPHTFRVLKLLASRGLSNHVLVITRFQVSKEDAEELNRLQPLRLTLLVTYSGIDDVHIEPVASSIAADSLRTAFRVAHKYRVIFYWRPLVPGLNDSDAHVQRAAELSKSAHATAFTGLFFRDAIREYYASHGLTEPYQDAARRKILPGDLERSILGRFKTYGGSAIFRKTSCAVGYAHGVSDYNGHYGIREICDICPTEQVTRCAVQHCRPSLEKVMMHGKEIGVQVEPTISDRAITFEALNEEPRYFLQHSLNYQVHDARHPHYQGQHGRASIGWSAIDGE